MSNAPEQAWSRYLAALKTYAEIEAQASTHFAAAREHAHQRSNWLPNILALEHELAEWDRSPYRHGTEQQRRNADEHIARLKREIAEVRVRYDVLDAASNAAAAAAAPFARQRDAAKPVIDRLRKEALAEFVIKNPHATPQPTPARRPETVVEKFRREQAEFKKGVTL